MFLLDEQRVLEAIVSTGVSAFALEEGSGLVDYWISECADLDNENETLAVEVGFFFEPTPLTFVVGTQDRIFRNKKTGLICGSEWKTTKQQTKLWTPEAWLESISNGHQVATYAAGLRYGNLLMGNSNTGTIAPGDLAEDGSVDILVRAISKSHPPVMWPDSSGALLNISAPRIEAVINAYVNAAEGVRVKRKGGLVPWQVPGLQCMNMFRKECPFLKSCRSFESFTSPSNLGELGKSFSPGSKTVVSKLIELGKITVDNLPEVVVLSASTLGTLQQCDERWRRESEASGDEEENEYLDIGTVLHAGVAELYRQQIKKEKE